MRCWYNMKKGIRSILVIVMLILFFSKGTVLANDVPLITNFVASPGTEVVKGTTVILQGAADNIEGKTLQFRYLLYDGGTWSVLSEGDTIAPCSWQTVKTGGFLLCFQIIENGQNYNQFLSCLVTDTYVNIGEIKTSITGNTVKITPSVVTNDTELKYTYQIYNLSSKSWNTLIRDTTENSYEWTPPAGGSYWINVAIKDKNGKNYARIVEYYAVGATITNFTSDKGSPQIKDTQITLQGAVSNPLNQELLYEYLYYNGSKWTVISKKSTLESASWKPQSAGNYLLCFQIYDKNGAVLGQKFIEYSIENLYVNVGSIKVEDLATGGHKLSSGYSTNDSNVEYQWKCYDIATMKWEIIRGFDHANAATWLPVKAGNYLINVEGRTSDGVVTQNIICYVVTGIQISSFKASVQSPQALNTTIQLSGSIKNPLADNLIYRFLEYNGLTWKELYSGNTLSAIDWNPPIGHYLLCLQVIDSTGRHYNKFMDYAIDPYTTTIKGLNVYSPDGKNFSMQANLTTNDSHLTYKYMYYDVQLSVWNVLEEGQQSYAAWHPLRSGNYWLHVEITGSDGVKYTKTIAQKVDGYQITGFAVNKSSPQKTNTSIVFSGTSKNVLGEELTYKYLLYNGSVWTQLSAKTTPHSYTWVPGQEGNYWVCYQVTNQYGIVNQSMITFKISNRVDFSDRLSTFNTYSTNTSNGTYNMMKALGVFNQVVIYPGQSLSFNGTTGYCGQAAGYLQAGVVGGIGYGGGICQASTTLYGAATRAGLTIVRRRNHSVASTYVPAGQDAMVDYGSSDLVIRNDFDFPVKIVTYTSGRYLFAEFYGNQPSGYNNIEVYSWTTGTYSAAAMRVYYKNGYEVGRQDLPSSYYKSAVR